MPVRQLLGAVKLVEFQSVIFVLLMLKKDQNDIVNHAFKFTFKNLASRDCGLKYSVEGEGLFGEQVVD